ncbi:MAG: hypothetical protein GYB68_00585 [Chloroflexi bacterium]|nr:hypothetical protein [Chloroflexota bacterium]
MINDMLRLWDRLTTDADTHSRSENAQSLVELALVLPLLLFILSGVLEIGNMLVYQNRAENLAREVARSLVDAPDGSMDSNIARMAEQSPAMDEEFLNVFVIRPVFNSASDGSGVEWLNQHGTNPWGLEEDGDVVEPNCIFGTANGCPSSADPEAVPDPRLQPADPLTDLLELSFDDAPVAGTQLAGTQFVIVVVRYDASTLFRFNWPGQTLNVETTGEGRVPLRAYGMFRQEIEDQTLSTFQSGCPAFPVGVSRDTLLPPAAPPVAPGEVVNISMSAGVGLGEGAYLRWRFDGPNPIPVAWDPANIVTTNDPNIGFQEYAATSSPERPPFPDRDLHKGDWVLEHVGGQPNQAQIDAIVGAQRLLLVVVYDQKEQHFLDTGNGETGDTLHQNPRPAFLVDSFARVRLSEGSIPGTLRIEFVRFDNGCGNDVENN